MPPKQIELVYEESEPGRLDQFLLEKLTGIEEYKALTRSQIKRWIEDGRIGVNGGKVSKAGSLLKSGYAVSVDPEPPPRAELQRYDLELEILHEDDDLIVVDKPADLSMHPGAGNRERTLVNALVGRFGSEAEAFPDTSRPGIVHRLDKDTSGVVVVARNVAALNALAKQFAERTVGRAYAALVFTTPRARREINVRDEGVIDTSFGRHPTRRIEMAVLKEGSRRAVTRWRVAERMPYACLLEVRLETGRTHQIRVHMQHIGSPVIGDPIYGETSGLPRELKLATEEFGRQALHAYSLEFDHPASGKRLAFRSALPQDLLRLIRAFGGKRTAL